jgi:hypothetical protein
MTCPNPEVVFAQSFDTFKAFKNLSLEKLEQPIPFPNSLWQILNHLIMWQEWQLGILSSEEVPLFDESRTWIAEKYPASQQLLDQAIDIFHGQLKAVQHEITRLSNSVNDQPSAWKIIQEMSLHLSFHLGEVVLIRRLMKDYPLSHQMKEFLTQE